MEPGLIQARAFKSKVSGLMREIGVTATVGIRFDKNLDQFICTCQVKSEDFDRVSELLTGMYVILSVDDSITEAF